MQSVEGGFKRHLLYNSFHISKPEKSQKQLRGGVIKVPKKCHVLFEWPLILYNFLTNDVRVFKTTENFSFKFEPVGDVALAVGLVQLLDGPRRPVHSHARRTLVQEHLHS